jgi:hypothetical protein
MVAIEPRLSARPAAHFPDFNMCLCDRDSVAGVLDSTPQDSWHGKTGR